MKALPTVLWVIGAAGLSAAAGCSTAATSALDTHFPLQTGNRWVYAGDPAGDVVFEVVGKERVAGYDCFVLRRTVGKDATTVHLAVTPEAIHIHRAGADTFDPPLAEFAFPFTEGRGWQWSGKMGDTTASTRSLVGNTSDVTVPAGKFKAVSVGERLTTGGSMGYTTFWLAKGVGIVKLVGKGHPVHNKGKDRFVWELKEFTVAAKPKG